MISIVARFNHAFAPNTAPEAVRALEEILTRPCFEVLSRISAMRGDRQVEFRPKTPSGITEILRRPANDSLMLDSGRRGELVAAGRFDTGRTAITSNPNRPAQLLSYVVLPVDRAGPALLDAFRDIAVALATVSGAVTAEPSFGDAQDFALSIQRDRKEDLAIGRTTELRLRERAAHLFSLGELDRRIGAPEWGLFLSAGHIRSVPPDTLQRKAIFADVRTLRPGQLMYLQATPDPADTLRPEFERTLGAVRDSLKPVLMDASLVPDAVWK
jgi:hypothetical protein